MLHLAALLGSAPPVTGGFHIGSSPWGLLVLVALGGLTYWFVRRRRDRQDRDDRDGRDDRR